ncbi:hypothetical protein [Vibrio sp. dhg]|uniref:hypothetical protein n=1 Tax=Vibrio sp. dhg TaxID=2163016 RepID=UPI000E4FD280|nr:hypothetical protein [Vibrio sp. dhg]AXT69662.1 hypothetical protein DBX26_00850 [Vibrio sp. dhg]
MENIPENIENVIISSEHFQSRLTKINEIEELYDFLKIYFKEIVIICYVREQFSYFLSSYSTKMKSGKVMGIDEYFEKCNSSNLFFNHFNMIENWSSVFNEAKFIVKDFNRSNLLDGDVVMDFYSLINIEEPSLFKKLNNKSNESLNNKGLYLALLINVLFKCSSFQVKNKWRAFIRSQLINKLVIILFSGKIKGYDYLKPLIEEEFKESNQLLKEKYFKE